MHDVQRPLVSCQTCLSRSRLHTVCRHRPQVVAAGRRKFFYVYDLAGGRVERVARVQGMDEERSMETFAASPAQDFPLLAFLGNGAHLTPVFLVEMLSLILVLT